MVTTMRPDSLRAALLRMAAGQVVPLAGGTDVMARYRNPGGTVPCLDKPVMLIGHLPELHGIRVANGRLEIGAACTLAEFLECPLVPEGWKAPAAQMASPAIRNLATVGGNLANASPAGDLYPLFAALDAKIVLASEGEERVVPVTSFVEGPGRTCRRSDELLARIHVPLPTPDCHPWYRKVGTRKANCLSKVSVFACSEVVEGVIHRVGCALGAVAPTVVRCLPAEDLLVYLPCRKVGERKADVLALYGEVIHPIDDQRASAAYRRETALRLVEAWLDSLTDMADK